MRKSIILLISIFFFILTFLVIAEYTNIEVLEIIGLKESSEEEPVELLYWGKLFPEEVMDRLIEDFEAQNPLVKINYEEQKFNDNAEYKQFLFNRIKNDRDNAPDIFDIHATWIPQLTTEISLENDAISILEFDKRFYSVAKNQNVSTTQKVLGIPLNYDALVLLYNIDHFRAAGLQPPKTWEDLRVAAQKLTIRGERNAIERSGVALGTVGNIWNYSDVVGLMLNQNRVEVPERINGAAAQLVFINYYDYAKEDKLYVWNDSFASSIAEFAAQNVSMIFLKTSDIENLMKINPTLNFSVAPVPQLPLLTGGTTKTGWATYWSGSVNQDISSTEQEAGWRFLAWLTEEPQQIKLNDELLRYKKIPYMYSNKNINERYLNSEYSEYFSPALLHASEAASNQLAGRVGNEQFEEFIVDIMGFLKEKRKVDQGKFTEFLTEIKDEYMKLRR